MDEPKAGEEGQDRKENEKEKGYVTGIVSGAYPFSVMYV